LKDASRRGNKYIIRGSLNSFGSHKFYELLPKSIRLYFLDYLESDILGEDYQIDDKPDKKLYHYISDYKRYKYFLVSEYSMATHSPIGEVYYIKI